MRTSSAWTYSASLFGSQRITSLTAQQCCSTAWNTRPNRAGRRPVRPSALSAVDRVAGKRRSHRLRRACQSDISPHFSHPLLQTGPFWPRPWSTHPRKHLWGGPPGPRPAPWPAFPRPHHTPVFSFLFLPGYRAEKHSCVPRRHSCRRLEFGHFKSECTASEIRSRIRTR